MTDYSEKLETLLEDVLNEESIETKHHKIQLAITEATIHAACPEAHVVAPSVSLAPLDTPVLLQELIDERKALPSSDRARRCQISKKIKKEVKRMKDEERSAKISRILENFSQIQSIKAIKDRRKMDLTIGMTGIDGKLKTDRASITEVFALFYEELYRSRADKPSAAQERENVEMKIPKFDANELTIALKSLKKGKARDSKGFVAEMLKVGGVRLRDILLQLMNAVLDEGAPTPTEWHKSVMKILFKGGDATQAKNYRPICVMPLLYKLFAVMLHKRLAPTLESKLSRDQAGFRQGFSTVDHLHMLAQIQEKTSEWQIPVWTCFIDYEKAFDSLEHEAIWAALAKQGITDGYIELLQRLYADQTGQVSVDSMLSRSFVLGRGTKQGDPLSTLLFNAVLEDAFEDVRPSWTRKKFGLDMSIGAKCHLTSVCFADDVVLVANNAIQIQEMIADLKKQRQRGD